MRRTIDAWPLATAGLASRSVTCLQRAHVRTIGELRPWTDAQLLALPAFGQQSLGDVHWFMAWARQLETGGDGPSDLRVFLDEFLTARQRNVIEQRFGLTDPLFRPWMKRETLREIGGELRGGITRERVRQIESESLTRLRSHLAQALAKGIQKPIATAQRGATVLGGYEPWGSAWLLEYLYVPKSPSP
jgi:hypothetical protein